MEVYVDVLIVGTGVSGLYSALTLREDLKILMISKSKITESNSYLAQGGIATARNTKDISLFIEDTLKAGQYANKLEAVRLLAQESQENINTLSSLGVRFDKKEAELLYTREGAHSISRIVHYKDETGKEVCDTLIRNVRKKKNICIYEDTYAIDILKEGNRCIGALAWREGEKLTIFAKTVIVATGGIGGIFKHSTNRRQITGDGISIAIKNGIKVKNLNYVQFHPTALYEKEKGQRKFLISESVRGEGAKLINTKGERFINELLPRDVVSKAIWQEILECGVPYVYLDATPLSPVYIKARFPNIYKVCFERGIDITKQHIPVVPAQHYFMGGIEVDLDGRTSMDNLFAVGEVSCTGVHGKNRLASNSLLEALVFSKRVTAFINKEISQIQHRLVLSKERIEDIETIKKERKESIILELKRIGGLKDELVSCG